MGDTQIIIEPGRQDIVFKREFDAPREVVFRALTDPTLIPNWWGPRVYETIVDEMDVRPGGRWRYINKSPEFETAFHGVYHEISPDRIVQTNEWEGMPGHVGLETALLEERDGRTLMTAIALFPSVEDRDANVANGMEGGARETYDRLDEMVKRLVSES